MPVITQIVFRGVRIATPAPTPAPKRPDLRRVVVAYARLLQLRERRVGATLGRAWRYTCYTPGSNDYTTVRMHLERAIALYGAQTVGAAQSFADINNVSIGYPQYYNNHKR
jgi:hypothetical protein